MKRKRNTSYFILFHPTIPYQSRAAQSRLEQTVIMKRHYLASSSILALLIWSPLLRDHLAWADEDVNESSSTAVSSQSVSWLDWVLFFLFCYFCFVLCPYCVRVFCLELAIDSLQRMANRKARKTGMTLMRDRYMYNQLTLTWQLLHSKFTFTFTFTFPLSHTFTSFIMSRLSPRPQRTIRL